MKLLKLAEKTLAQEKRRMADGKNAQRAQKKKWRGVPDRAPIDEMALENEVVVEKPAASPKKTRFSPAKKMQCRREEEL